MPTSKMNVRITWRAGILITTLVFVGVLVFVLATLPSEAGRDDDGRGYVWLILLALIAICVLVIWSRLWPLRNPGERMAVLKKIGIAVSLIVAAVIVTLLSISFGTFSFLGQKWFLLPTGLYLAAMAILANAMNPEHGSASGKLEIQSRRLR